jgi:drug/metabolite transporter (DMT)-like permease
LIENKPRRWTALVYLMLLIVVVPWYWPAGDARHVFGLPYWVIVTLAAVFITSAFTAWVYLSRADDDSD